MTNSKQWNLESNLSENAKTQIFQWANSRVKVSRNSWDIDFILQAYLVSNRSLDAQTKCGCVLVRDKTIVGTGYNSFIRNIDDSVLPNVRPNKYPFMIHAEHNAILNCAKNGISCEGATAYITGQPCASCLQYMYQAGISEICYGEYEIPHMMQNKQYDTQFEILSHLMKNFKIVTLDFDEETLEKIRKIKSC